MTASSEETTRKLYQEAVIIDGLNVSNWDSPAVFESLHAGGVTAFNATVATLENYTQTLDHIAAWLLRFRTYEESLVQIKSVEDILQAKRDNRVGVILGFQNATPIENDLDRLALFHALGVRIIQLTFHECNLLGSGCYERRDDGLSHFGVDAIEDMNRLGILIDLSHVGVRSTMEAIEASGRPVAITHANAKSYYDVPRNKTEDALKLAAERGGVIGATAITAFLRTGFDSTLADYIDAIDSMVSIVGIDHVGIGTDFTQDQPESFGRYIGSQQGTKFPAKFVDLSRSQRDGLRYPLGLESPDEMPNLAGALLDRGYRPADVEKILGGNWLRLFREIWDD